MRCAKCGAENKRTARFCSDCGAALAPAPAAAARPAPSAPAPAAEPSGPFWQPDWKWHLKALGAIAALVTALYFAVSLFLSRVPEPYRMRDIPPEMTPWLKR